MTADDEFDSAFFDACDLLAQSLVERLGDQITDDQVRIARTEAELRRLGEIVHKMLREYAEQAQARVRDQP